MDSPTDYKTVHRTVLYPPFGRAVLSSPFRPEGKINKRDTQTGIRTFLFIDTVSQSYGLRSRIYGLSHGLKIARQLSIFAPVCGISCAIFALLFFTGRDSFAFSPKAKIKVRLGLALAGGAHPRRI